MKHLKNDKENKQGKKMKITFKSSSASKEEKEEAIKRAYDILFTATFAEVKKKKIIKK